MTIRMFKDVATFMRLLLLFTRDNHGSSITPIMKYCDGVHTPVYLGADARREAYQDVRRLSGNNFQYEFDLDRLVNELSEQLRHADSPNSDVSVIDEICRILNFPYGRNAISSEMLKRLRRAIMMPDEVASLRALVEQRENHCIGCGNRLMDGQIVSLGTDNRTNERVIYCTMCVPPEYLPCKECGEVHGLSKNLRTAIGKGAKCTKGVEPQVAPEMPVIHPPPAPDEPRRGAIRLDAPGIPENFRRRQRLAPRRPNYWQEVGRQFVVPPNPYEDGPQQPGVVPEAANPRPQNPEGRHDQ